MSPTVDATALAEGIVSATRAALGDDVRSVILLTPEDHEVAYLRADLYDDGDRAAAIKRSLVETERRGFDAAAVYGELTATPNVEPGLGDYRYTVRAFSSGYLCRILVGEQGVLVTTDELDVDAFDHLAVSLRSLLSIWNDGDLDLDRAAAV